MYASKKFGVQQAYSYGGRKRYNAGRYMTKKYGGKKAYTRRTNIRKGIMSGQSVFKLQDLVYIHPANTAANRYTWNSGNTYLPIRTAIQASNSWATIAANWSLFRINGIKISVSKMYNDVTGSLQNSTSPSPALWLNYYPSVDASSYDAKDIMEADSAFRVDAYQSGLQTKYISIPKNFSNLTNGIGIGTWNPTLSIASLTGQISCGGNYANLVPAAVTTYPSFEVQIVFYVSVCNDRTT